MLFPRSAKTFCCCIALLATSGCGGHVQTPATPADGSATAPSSDGSQPVNPDSVGNPSAVLPVPESGASISVETSAQQLPTLPTAPKELPAVGKDHIEFGPEMADVLSRYRTEAEERAKRATKAEPQSLRGNPRTLAVPVPKDDKLRLGRDADERFYQFRMRDVESYLAKTPDTEAAKSAGEEFLRGYVAQAVNRPDAPNTDQMLALSQKAADAGCADPLVRAYQAFYKIGRNEQPDIIEDALLSTVDQLPPNAVARVFVRLWLCKLGHILNRSDPDRLPQLCKATVDWLAAEQADPQWRECVLWRYSQAMALLTLEEQEAVLGTCLQAGTADPWLMHFSLGNYYRDVGWHYRGRGMAGTVTEEGWRRVNENLPLSALHFRHAWLLDPTIPDAPGEMIFVSGAGFDKLTSPYQWFLRSTSARFDYWKAYYWLLEMLSDRWGPGVEAQLAFGEQCLATNRFDTSVPFEAIATVKKYWGDAKDPEELERARAQLRKYLEKRRTAQEAQPEVTLAVDTPERRSSLADRLLRVDMPQEAVAELLALGPAKLHVRTFQEAGALGEFYVGHQMAKWTVNSEAADELDRVVRRSYGGGNKPKDYLPTRKLLEEHASKATDDFSRRFFKQVDYVLGQHEQRCTGEWVDLRFTPQLLGWEGYVDQWEVDAESNSLRLWRHDVGTGQLRIRPIGDFRAPTEIELELEILEPHPYPRAVGVHYVLHHLWTDKDWNPGQPLFGIEPRLEVVNSAAVRRDYVVMPGNTMQLEYAPLPTTGVHKLRLKLWENNVYEFEVDGYRWLRRLPEPLNHEKLLGFGEAWPEYGGEDHTGGFRIANLRLRKIPNTPPLVE